MSCSEDSYGLECPREPFGSRTCFSVSPFTSALGLPVYQKPTVEKLGTFRELTRWGFSSASDGGSILGIGSPGCQTDFTQWGYGVVSINCPTGPTAS